ncbi:MAG: 50S ribosomal protein L28 [Spirochaetes bacterium]|nr:50S ribosomal protein L28 [Spirochaetota bacterium]
MSKKCDICGKGTMSGNSVSHSHLKTRRKWQPNIKKIRAKVGKSTKFINTCTRCLRSGKVEKAL